MTDSLKLSDKSFHSVTQYVGITVCYASTSSHIVHYSRISEKLSRISGNICITFSLFGLVCGCESLIIQFVEVKKLLFYWFWYQISLLYMPSFIPHIKRIKHKTLKSYHSFFLKHPVCHDVICHVMISYVRM